MRFSLNPLGSCLFLPFPSPPSLLPLAVLGFLDSFSCQIPPGPECTFFRIGIRLPLNLFESYLFFPLPFSPPSLPPIAISLAPLIFSVLRALSPHNDVDDCSGVDSALQANEVVDGASGELLVINGVLLTVRDGVLDVCGFLSKLSLAEDGDEVLNVDEGIAEDDSELLEIGLFSFSVRFSFCSLSFFFSFLLLEPGLNLSLSGLFSLPFDVVLGSSLSSSLGSSCFLISAAFSVG